MFLQIQKKDCDYNIYYFILNALLGGSSIYEKKLTIMMCNKDNWLTIFLKRNSTSSTSSTVLYLVGITEFLTNVIRFIRRSFRLMMKWYYVESTVAKSFDVEMIRYEFSPPGKDLIQIRQITLILKLLLSIMDVVLSSRNGRSQRLLLLTYFYNFIIYNI